MMMKLLMMMSQEVEEIAFKRTICWTSSSCFSLHFSSFNWASAFAKYPLIRACGALSEVCKNSIKCFLPDSSCSWIPPWCEHWLTGLQTRQGAPHGWRPERHDWWCTLYNCSYHSHLCQPDIFLYTLVHLVPLLLEVLSHEVEHLLEKFSYFVT